jgi:hypothetical protein
MFDMCSVNYSATVNATLAFFPWTQQLWNNDVSYGLWNPFSKLLKKLWHRKLAYLEFHISPEGEVA